MSTDWTLACETSLLAGDFAKAQEILDAVSWPEEISQQRIMLHLRSQIQIQLGDLDGAKSNLLRAERYFGENVAVLRDLACVYYQTGEMVQWLQYVEQLKGRLALHRDRLSAQTKVQCKVTLGKFLEELGRVAEASDLYHEAEQSAEAEGRSDLVRLALIQRLRVEALFTRGPDLSRLYTWLLAIPKDEITFDLYVEREHSLMLAEIELIGPQHGWLRVAALMSHSQLTDADQRLLVSDFLMEAMTKHLPVTEEALALAPLLEDGDAYEREIGEISRQQQTKTGDLARLNTLIPELSWGCYLRLLTLHHQTCEGANLKTEIARKLALILGDLPPSSRFYWMRRVQPQVLTLESKLLFDVRHHVVSYQGKQLDLSKKRTLCGLLEQLSISPSLDVDTLIRRLWQSEFSPEHLHRLRMSARRLNELLFELSAIPRVIEMTSDRVSVKGSVSVTAVS